MKKENKNKCIEKSIQNKFFSSYEMIYQDVKSCFY